jgi:uncharacterized membrane protein YdbT with pleckstrin-like domain
VTQPKVDEKTVSKKKKEEKELYDSTPSMFLNRPFVFLFSVIAVVLGVIGLIGLIFFIPAEQEEGKNLWIFLSYVSVIIGCIGFMTLFFWWLRVVNTRLTVTNERVTFREGILSKNIREIFLSDIRSVQINQRLLQRLFGTGYIEVASAASAEAEIQINGIPKTYTVKEIIDTHRRKDRSEMLTKETNKE